MYCKLCTVNNALYCTLYRAALGSEQSVLFSVTNRFTHRFCSRQQQLRSSFESSSQCRTVQCSAAQFSAVQCDSVQWLSSNAVQFSSIVIGRTYEVSELCWSEPITSRQLVPALKMTLRHVAILQCSYHYYQQWTEASVRSTVYTEIRCVQFFVSFIGSRLILHGPLTACC